MNSLSTSAFDLPDRLAAKADPALIADDEQHFAAIVESLEQSVADEHRSRGGCIQLREGELEYPGIGLPQATLR